MSRDPDVFGLQVKDLAQGQLQGEEVGPGGPQQVGKHPTDLLWPRSKSGQSCANKSGNEICDYTKYLLEIQITLL